MVWSVLERARRAKKRKWIFRLLALAFPFLVLAGIECGLRLGNVGIDAHLVVRNLRAGRMTSYCLHPQFDVAYCGIDLRGPEPREFELPKPPKMLRVAVVGASTVQGYPYPSELAFPQHMELLLSRQIADREISVINCGIIGLSTTPLVEVVSQVLVAAPDVIVFYEGHNEFYGVGGVATNAKLDSLTIHARRYRLGQLLTKWKSANVFDSESLISQLPGDLWIDNESDLVTQAAERYRRNLRTVASLCVRAKVPLVLCGIASNLRDQSPARRRSANGHDPQELGIPDEGQFDLFNDLFQQRRFAKARDLAVTAVSTTPEDASWNYRLAQCYEELGETGKAAKCYQTACDLDPCRYRAPSELRKITRDIAAEFGPSVHFLDLAEAFAAHSNFPAPGEDLFLEHVHFTQEGHWFAAICVARCLVQQVFSLEWNEEAVPTDSDRDEWLGILPEDHLVATVLAFFMGQRPPFRFAVDQPRHQSRLAAKIESIANQLSPIQRDDFMSLSHRAKMDDLVDSLGRQQLARGRLEAALRLFNLSTRRRPWMPNGYVFSAICEHRLGRENLAKDAIEQSRRTPVAETPALLRDRQRLESQMKTRN